MSHIRNACTVAMFALFAGGAVQAADTDASVTIKNSSAWEIHELYLSSTDEEKWGPDQLGDNVLASGGGSFTLNEIPCDAYDVKIVDEDADECVVAGVALCADKDAWVIEDDALLECQNESE